MLKRNENNIGNFNLIGTFIILVFIAFMVIMLSVNSKIDQFENLQKEIKLKFLLDKKEDIRFKLSNINLLIKNQTNTDESKKFIKDFIEQINLSRHYIITIQKLSQDMPYYGDLINDGEYFKSAIHLDKNNKNKISTIQYFILNKSWNWVISTQFDDDIINEEISTWEKHLDNLIRDNIYVHISLLFLFTISLLLVTYVINKFANRTIFKYKRSLKERERVYKQKLNKLQAQLDEQIDHFCKQKRLIQKQSKMLALGEMLGNLCHQWRQPLTQISDTATGIKNKIETHMVATNEDIEKLTHINNSALYLSRTIDDFRVFLKADSLKIDFVISEIIEKALLINKSIIEKNKIKIIQELDTDIMIHNLSFGLLQALVNIIYNAKDVLKKLDVEDRYIFLSTKNYENKVEITITDTGNGIPEEIIGNIFQPYFTTKQKTYGTGLGLHMAYNIIEQNMSGTITVSNKQINYKNSSYMGASFIITLFLKEK